MDNARERTNHWMQRKQKNFGAKYGNRKNITENSNGLITWKKKLQGLNEGPEVDMHLIA